MIEFTATYSPDDNKLRLEASQRLDAETYARVKAAGFKWAPKLDQFIAPMWTPGRADLCIELAGQIDDDDRTLTERAEDRAERFEDYSEKRGAEAEQARKAVSAIADNIPFGQPILVGHHSEKHARRDAANIENGMRKAVNLWKTSAYWTERAEAAIRHAKYKERPDVRARRIKGLESDQRKSEKNLKQCEAAIKLWETLHDDNATAIKKKAARCSGFAPLVNNGDYRGELCAYCGEKEDAHKKESAPPTFAERALWVAGNTNTAGYGTYSDLTAGKITPEQAQTDVLRLNRECVSNNLRWLEHIGFRLEYERAMLAAGGGTVADKTGPEKGGACRCWASPSGGWSYIQKVNKVSVTLLDNWGNGGRNFTRTIAFDKLAAVMTAAQVAEARTQGRIKEYDAGRGFYLLKSRDEFDRDNPPGAEPTEPAPDNGTKFEAMQASLKAGVQVVTAPALFPTPPDIAARMVELADIEPGQCVLEPSAGTGAIVRAVVDSVDTEVLCYEINRALCSNLERTFPSYRVAVRCRDFLEVTDHAGEYPRVLINPPFTNGEDIKHILHARRMLKPGGRLVAICADGPRQRERLQPLADSWEELPAGTFAGTGARAVLLTMGAA